MIGKEDAMPKGCVRWLLTGLVGLVLLFILAQVVPAGSQDNPPVTQEAPWDNPRARELAVVACYNCHSNEVVWPWYSSLAPVSWFIQSDVERGRRALNFSEWDRRGETDELLTVLLEGSMPPWYYRMFHPQAKLSAFDRADLARGLDFLATQ
jgi:hypothetical protein